MTAIVLPDIDRSTIEELRKKIPNLTEIELPSMPSMQEVGKTADETIDRLLGRQRSPVWPWIAAGLGVVALIGAVAAWFTWFRRPTWESPASDTWSTGEPTDRAAAGTTTDATDATGGSRGLSAAETSLASNPYPIEEA